MASRRKLEVDEFKALVLLRKRKPHILVEGTSGDKKFYEDIIYRLKRDYVVEPIGNYKKTSNCSMIIEFMDELDKILDNSEQKKYFLGIIDGDGRRYKDDMPPKNELLYVLHYYSWESYFINRDIVKLILENYYIGSLITENTVDYIYNNIKKELLDKLWLCTLEKIKDNSDCKEKNSGSVRKDTPLHRLDYDNNFLRDKEEDLLKFAENHKLIRNKETLLSIAKGKFALWFFIRKFRILDRLPQLCRDEKISEIIMCDYCKDADSDNCSYKIKMKFKMEKNEILEKFLENQIKGFVRLVDIPSLTPIKERISQLK